MEHFIKKIFQVVPKCSSHPGQELLFCETCDCVFCSLCTSEGHINTREAGAEGGNTSVTDSSRNSMETDHTVIPFSIAIKRMSEILLYKAKECTTKVRPVGGEERENERCSTYLSF